MLMVGRTGIGKTHFMRMLGTVLGDITLNFTQLLSLSADQMATLKGAHQDYGSVEAHNLDELPMVHGTDSTKLADEIIPRLDEICDDTRSIVFLILSPQYLT